MKMCMLSARRVVHRSASLATVILLVAGCSHAVEVYDISELSLPLKRAELANGMRVVVARDDEAVRAHVILHYDVGAIDDPEGKRGLAHYVEHLAFRRGDKWIEKQAEDDAAAGSGQAAKAKKRKGNVREAALKEDIPHRRVTYLSSENAHTTYEETVYYKSVRPGVVDRVLDAYRAQMGDFTSDLSDEVIEVEREVVRNERRYRYESDPRYGFLVDLFQHLVPEDDPYHGHAVIGSHEEISSFTREDVSAFLQKNYHPANATLTVVGPIDVDETLGKILERFESLPAKEPRNGLPASSMKVGEASVEVRDLEECQAWAVWPYDGSNVETNAVMKLYNNATSMYYELVINREVARSAGVFTYEHNGPSLFVGYVMVDDCSDLAAAKRALIERVKLLPFDVRELQVNQAKYRMTYNVLYHNETPVSLAETMAGRYARLGHPTHFSEEFDALRSLTRERVRDVGIEIFDDERAFVLIRKPAESKPSGSSVKFTKGVDSDRDVKGEQTDPGSLTSRESLPIKIDFEVSDDEVFDFAVKRAAKLDDVVEETLPNGLRVRITQRGQLPLTTATVVLGGGDLALGETTSGPAGLLASNLRLFDRDDWRNWGAFQAASRFGASTESLEATVKVLTPYTDEMLRLLAKRVFDPYFSAWNVKRQRESWSQAAKTQRLSTVAAAASWRARGMPWQIITPDPALLDTIYAADLEKLHEKIAYPENAVLAIATALPVETVMASVRTHFGAIPTRGEEFITPSLDYQGNAQPRLVWVPKRNVQSYIHVTLDADASYDWQSTFFRRAAANWLRESVKRVRQAYGFTYGVEVFESEKANVSSIGISTQVEESKASAALELILQTLVVREVDLEVLPMLRRQLVSSIIRSGVTSWGFARTQAYLMREKRPLGFSSERVEWLRGLSDEDFAQGIRDVITGSPVIVVVGPKPVLSDDTEKRFPGLEESLTILDWSEFTYEK